MHLHVAGMLSNQPTNKLGEICKFDLQVFLCLLPCSLAGTVVADPKRLAWVESCDETRTTNEGGMVSVQ